jgi:hypothetical protein
MIVGKRVWRFLLVRKHLTPRHARACERANPQVSHRFAVTETVYNAPGSALRSPPQA